MFKLSKCQSAPRLSAEVEHLIKLIEILTAQLPEIEAERDKAVLNLESHVCLLKRNRIEIERVLEEYMVWYEEQEQLKMQREKFATEARHYLNLARGYQYEIGAVEERILVLKFTEVPDFSDEDISTIVVNPIGTEIEISKSTKNDTSDDTAANERGRTVKDLIDSLEQRRRELIIEKRKANAQAKVYIIAANRIVLTDDSSNYVELSARQEVLKDELAGYQAEADRATRAYEKAVNQIARAKARLEVAKNRLAELSKS